MNHVTRSRASSWLIPTLVLAAAAIALLSTSSVQAQPRPIDGGTFEVGLDNILLVSFSEVDIDNPAGGDPGTASELDVAYTGGLHPRFFVIDRLSVGLSLNLFYRLAQTTSEIGGMSDETEASDFGFLGFATLHYFLPLNRFVFFKPGLGLGAFFGTRERPGAMPGIRIESDLSGFAGRVDIGFQFQLSDMVNLKTGLAVIPWFGSETPPDSDESESFRQVDAGFNLGVGVTF